jgi:membrane-bound lytic murein transglycosylase D
MLQRNVVSPIRSGFARLLGHCLILAACALPSGHAAAQNTPFSMVSLMSPSLALQPGDPLTVEEVHAAPQPASTIDLTAAPDDLWIRLRNGFAMADLNDDLTLHYQQWYQNRPDMLRRMVERSRPFMHYIVEELENRGMPTELALLPMVESSFNPMAYSRAAASGLWQFIPATGKRFNLEQNWWRDQRRDIVASTSAALDYLQNIYEMHGDWHLALASYNWGEGAVKRAIEKNESRGLPTDYPNLTMPSETRNYVPKLQALKNIFANPLLCAQLGIPSLPNRPYFATQETPRPMDVKTAARLAGISLDEFVRLNPSHNRPVMKADTSLIIPADKLDTFRANLASNDAPLTEWQAYALKPGERIDQVADRFGIPLAELARVNGLPSRIRLAPGTTLLVPAGKGASDLHAYLNAPSLPQIIEPEPVVTKGRKGKAAAGKKDSKLASAKGKGNGKNTHASSAKGSKTAAKGSSGKPSASKTAGKAPAKPTGKPAAKVAANHGRRG